MEDKILGVLVKRFVYNKGYFVIVQFNEVNIIIYH